MEWFSQNWVWVLFFIAFIAMHLFGHGEHGGHAGRGGALGDSDSNAKPAGTDNARDASKPSRHQH